MYTTKVSYYTLKVSTYFFLSLLLIGLPLLSWLYGVKEKELLVTVIGLWGLFWSFAIPKKKISFNWVDYSIVLFSGYQIISFTLQEYSLFQLTFLWRLSITWLYFILRFSYGDNKKELWNIFTVLLLIRFGIEFCIAGLQFFELINISKNKYFPISGTFHTPNFLAAFFVIGFNLILYFINYNRKKILQVLAIGILILILVFLVVLESRSAFVFLSISIVFQGYFFSTLMKKLRVQSRLFKIASAFLVIILSITSVFYLYQKKQDSSTGRLLVYKISSQEIGHRPIFGYGLFSFVKTYNAARIKYFRKQKRSWNEIKNSTYLYTATNDYLEIILETGIFSILLILFIFIKLFYKNKLIDGFQKISFIVFIGILISGFFISVSRSDLLMILLLFSILILGSMEKKAKKKEVSNMLLIPRIFFSVALSLFLCYSSIKRIHANKQLTTHWSSKATMDKDLLADFRKWFEILDDDGKTVSTYGHFLYQQGFKKEGLLKMNQGMNITVAPRITRKLAHTFFKEKKYSKTEKLLVNNTYNEPYRFSPKVDLAKFYKATQDTLKFVNTLKSIIETPVKIPSKKVIEIKNYAKQELQALKDL